MITDKEWEDYKEEFSLILGMHIPKKFFNISREIDGEDTIVKITVDTPTLESNYARFKAREFKTLIYSYDIVVRRIKDMLINAIYEENNKKNEQL